MDDDRWAMDSEHAALVYALAADLIRFQRIPLPSSDPAAFSGGNLHCGCTDGSFCARHQGFVEGYRLGRRDMADEMS